MRPFADCRGRSALSIASAVRALNACCRSIHGASHRCTARTGHARQPAGAVSGVASATSAPTAPTAARGRSAASNAVSASLYAPVGVAPLLLERIEFVEAHVKNPSFTMSKRAIITGITGQDGSYLAELLLRKGYEVFGIVRRVERAESTGASSTCSIASRCKPADLLDQLSLIRLVDEVRPHEFYNLAAMSFVPASWDQPMLTGEFNAQGVTRVLEAIRQVDPKIRFYQASSSEMFGKVREVPQTELTPFYPRSPYGVSKVFAHYITVNYRESYDLFAVSGHPVQSRVAAPRPRVRHPQGDRRRRAHQARARRHAVARQPRRAVATGALPATTCARCG